jgi:NAD(P)-dependent dehydrogenase (short-subunit alcohol dehydrogenase family)
MGGEAIFVRADGSSAADVEAMVSRTVDSAFNNAGISVLVLGPMHEFPEEMLDRVVNINMKGVWLCMKYEVPQLLQPGGGTIVNTASIMGLVGSPTGKYGLKRQQTRGGRDDQNCGD